jgi:hypothetical protein
MTAKTFGDEIDACRAMFRAGGAKSPRLEFSPNAIRELLHCDREHAYMILDRLERDKFISEPDVNGHRRLL